MSEVVIVDAVRSAVGKRNGSLAKKHSADLLADVLTGLFERNPGVDPGAVEHVIGGCVTQAGMQSGNVARTGWLTAGLPLHVPAVTVTVQCGSSQQATTMGTGMVAGGVADILVACGVEVMSGVPMGSAMNKDPYTGEQRSPRYEEFYEVTSQFQGSELIAKMWNMTRDELDAFGKRSQDLAAQAWAQDRFAGSIVPVSAPVADDNGNVVGTKPFDRDEGMRETTLEGLAKLRTNMPDGLHTAGTSSQISDGSGALLLMTAEKADELGLQPKARIVSSVLVGSDPVPMLTGPIPASQKLFAKTGLTVDDIDVFEINEAFASVVLAWQKEIKPDPAKVNPNGGAISLGHPLGGTGAILITKALYELIRTGGRYGLISMCCGGGLGTGTIIERL
ncbi:MAG: acetyl-CoA C-acyltransferase [Acidimicrobiia bacterium]